MHRKRKKRLAVHFFNYSGRFGKLPKPFCVQGALNRRKLNGRGVFAKRPKSREQTIWVFARKPTLNDDEFVKPILQLT